MATDITLKDKNGGIKYPKTVTAIVYENGTGKTLQTIIDEMRQVDAATNTRTQHFKADVNNLDTLKNKTDIGLYNYVGTGWRGSVSVCYDSADNVSQVALSSSTPSYNGNTLTWISAQPCAMARTYTNGAWSHWEKVGAPVVNDLTTGGTDKALSAEMGKELKSNIDALGQKIDRVVVEEITYSQYPGNNYNPGPSNWAKNKGSHVAVPVSDLGGAGAKIKLTTEAFGYVCFVTSYTTPTTTTSAIPFAHAADVTNNNGTTSMSGRITVNGRTAAGQDWYFVIPDNASHFIIGTKDWDGNAANFSLYTVNTISVYDKVYEVENRVVDVEQEITDFDARIAEIEDSRTHIYTQLPLDGYSGNEYNPGPTNWAKGQGAHIAIPISDLGGSGAKIKLIANPYGYVCFVTSYTTPKGTGAIPFAHAAEVTNKNGTSTISGRIAITANDVWYLAVPDNASHLILSTKDYGGVDANFVLTLIEKISIQDIVDNSKSAYLIDREIPLSDYSQSKFALTESGGWYSIGNHKAIPVSDLGGAGITLALTTTDANTTYCAFFTNYAVPTASGSPVYFVGHTNCARRRGREDAWYSKRIQLFKESPNYITIPSDAAYLIINTVDGSGVNAEVKLFTTFENPLNLNDAVEKIHNEMLVKSFSDWVSYEGSKISLKRPKLKIKRICKTPRCQGIWYRNGYFFNIEMKTNKRFELYHLENGSLVLQSYWGLQDTVGATYVSSSEGVHGNSMQLTNIYYDNTDEFPIFTVGGQLGTLVGKIYVMRLYKDGNDVWQLTKLYDIQGESFGMFALEDGTIANFDSSYVKIYNKRITADNTETINVTDADIAYTYADGFNGIHLPQDMVSYGSKIFLLEGDTHTKDANNNLLYPGRLMVYDCDAEKCVNNIYLIPLGITVEPEGIDIDDEIMYIAENGENNNGYLWELRFD